MSLKLTSILVIISKTHLGLYVYTSLKGLLWGDQSPRNGCILSLKTNAFVKKTISDSVSLRFPSVLFQGIWRGVCVCVCVCVHAHTRVWVQTTTFMWKHKSICYDICVFSIFFPWWFDSWVGCCWGWKQGTQLEVITIVLAEHQTVSPWFPIHSGNQRQADSHQLCCSFFKNFIYVTLSQCYKLWDDKASS